MSISSDYNKIEYKNVSNLRNNAKGLTYHHFLSFLAFTPVHNMVEIKNDPYEQYGLKGLLATFIYQKQKVSFCLESARIEFHTFKYLNKKDKVENYGGY